MLFQGNDSVVFIVALIIATIIVTLLMYVAVRAIDSRNKASDKKIMILLCAFLAVFILPIIAGAIGTVLNAIGNILADIRNLIDGGGRNALGGLIPIIYFLMLFVCVKFLVDTKWESAVWVSLLTLFLYYIILTILPELGMFVGVP